MVLEIGVVDYNQFRVYMRQRCADGLPFALVFLMADPDPAELGVGSFSLEGCAEACYGLTRSVLGAIVYYDHLN